MAKNTRPKIYRGNNAVEIVERTFDVELTPQQKRIVKLEGYATQPYKDDKGNWTTGVGQTGIYMDMTPIEAMEAKEREVSEYIPSYSSLPTSVKTELFQLHYRGDLAQSPKFRELFNAGKSEEASVELLNHQEYKKRKQKVGASYRDGVVKRLEEAAAVFANYNNAPSMTPEEQELTQRQLEGLFGETATAPSSIDIPGRKKEFSKREVSERATNVRQLIKDSLGIAKDKATDLITDTVEGADKVVEGLDKAEAAMRTGIPKVLDATAGAIERAEPVVRAGLDTLKSNVLSGADRAVEGLDKAEAVTRQAMDATLAKADTAVEGLDRAEAALRSRLGMEPTSEPVPEEPVEEPPVPSSITIPGRERVFPVKPTEEVAKEVRRSIVTPAEEPETIQEAIIKQEEPKPIPYEPKTITRIPADFGQRITLEDIQRSASLREYRALPGDVFKDGKLYRVYSEKPSKVSTPEEETKLGAIQNLVYGFDRYGNTIEENVGDYLKTIIPMNASAIPTESDPYADVFAKADSDTRRDMLANQRYRDLIEEYGYETVISPPTGAAITGGFVGSLLSPTTLIPLGGTVRTGALLGAALSAGYTASADLAERGEIRVVPTASSAILGGVLGGGLAALTRPSKLISYELLLDKNGKLLNASQMPGRLAKLQREGKATPKQIKATHDYYTVSKPVAEAEQKIAQQGPISRMMSPIVDRYLGTFNTTLKKYSSLLAQRVRTYEINSHIKIANSLRKATPFIASFNKLSKTTADDIAYRIGLGQFDEAKNLMPVSMQTEFEDVIGLLKGFEADLKKAGHTFEPIENYFPRLVKDYDALTAALGREPTSAIQKQIAAYARLTGKAEADLSIETLADISDKYLRGLVVKPRKGGGATFVKESRGKMGIVRQRELDKILEQQKELMQYYASPSEALQNYITKAVTDIEKRRALGVYGSKAKSKAGKELVEDSDGFLDADSSLGFLIQKERAKGDWSIENEKEIVELLRGYFVGGNQSPGSVVRFLRTAGYAGTIANPISAITQFGDLGMSGAIHGFRNTISAMLGEKNIKLVDNGLKSLAEFEDPKRTGAFLEKLFKYSGFATIDRIGKETTMQAALNKAQQLAQTTAGRETLRKKYGQVFGKEFDNFIGDLQRKEITDNVKYYGLNELADVQPVFLSELPRAYIENPNGRVLYMLKSYTLKAYDVVRNQVIQEYARGNKAEAIKKAAALAAYLSLANAGTSMTKDFLLGRDVKPEQIPDRALWGLLGVFGANQYVSERYLSRGDLTGFAKNLITPATPLLDEAFKLGGDIVGGDLEEDFFKYAKPVPIVGNIAYNWLGGGAEAWNERNK